MKSPTGKTSRIRDVTATPGVQPTSPAAAHGLTLAQYAFCLSYLSNGFNATRAYLDSHAGAAYSTAMCEGQRSTRNPKIAAYLASALEAHWKAEQMSGEEALARIARTARFNVAQLFDSVGKLLPPSEWPHEAGELVEAIDADRGKVKLPSRLAALRTVAEVTGKVKSTGEGLDALAAAIREDLEKHRATT